MPPKQQQKPSSSKVKDDKTFGLKNVSPPPHMIYSNLMDMVSRKINQQKFRKILLEFKMSSLVQERTNKREKALRAKEKADAEKRKKEEGELFKPVQVAQKVPFGVGMSSLALILNDVLIVIYQDPKTVLCVYFKAGNCDKGNKCKFSHDRDVERKQEKKDIYSDSRDDKANG
ncbi:zf-CCCH domain-containing protein [Rhizoctonia solani AG-1 IA]|uniref:Zf-CCCH domain-containing protein n=1 Tax=Thanatephorus cucumeris (strain AG1-IA) TaxID=983506 RepID=L8WW13_THACA|nr:zf-CCCH domain-containing protein [Rhizoctonia solani AG-1 IA]